MDFTTSKHLFDLLVAPLMRFLPQAALAHSADYRTHKFSATHHVLLTIFAQLTHIESANELVDELNDLGCKGQPRHLRQLIGFDFKDIDRPVQLNQSSFSRANQNRSYRLWRYCFHQLFANLRPRLAELPELAGLGKLVAVDGTLLDCLGRMSWAVYRKNKNKLKGHFFFDLAGLPERLVLTTGKGSERAVLDQWLYSGVTYLLDRGYNDYTLFQEIGRMQAFFVTRLYINAFFVPLENLPVPAEASQFGVMSDQLIELGQPSHPAKPLQLRRVVYRDPAGVEYTYLTNRFDLSVLDVVRLYLYRWEIENLFKWLKRHLNVQHWYSECENGVLIQLYAALITFVLLKLYALKGKLVKAEYKLLGRNFMWWLHRHLFATVTEQEFNAYLVATGCNHTSDTS